MSKLMAGLVLVVACVPAMAACGGGGWRHESKSSDSTAPMASAPRIEAEQPQNVAYVSSRGGDRDYAREQRNIAVPGLDTSRFDKLQSRLGLSRAQREDAQIMRLEIQRELSRLTVRQHEAQTRLNECRSGCDSERRELDRANEALRRFDPNGEFDRRLDGILWDRQRAIYFSRR